MGLLRNRGGDQPLLRFQMRQRLLSVGDDYWIEDEAGQRAFLVDGKGMIRWKHSGPLTDEIVHDELIPRLSRLEQAQ